MDPRGWLAAASLVVLLGCQAPSQATPPPASVAPILPPTLAPRAATLAPPAPTATRVAPLPTASPVVPASTSQASAPAPAATASRLEVLNAANAAFAGGKLTDAAGLYERVVNTPPGAGESESAARALTEFAQFRGLVTSLGDGREEEARASLAALQQRDPSAPLARLADQLYNQYGMVGQLRGACAQLQPAVASQAGATLAALQALGVTGVDAASLCSVP